VEDEKIKLYFEMETTSGAAKYVIFELDGYSQKLLVREHFYDRLKVVFSNDSPYLIRVFDGFEFRAVFIQRLGKKRLFHLANHLLVINKDIFNALDWEIMLTKKDWKKLMKRL